MNITVVSYKPESEAYCRGCLTDRYSSGFELNSYSSLKQAAGQIAQCDAVELGYGEASWQHTVIISADPCEVAMDYDQEESVREQIVGMASQFCATIIQKREEKKRLDAAAAKEREAEAQRLRDLQQFEALKAKLGK